jgi:hypothetical protein
MEKMAACNDCRTGQLWTLPGLVNIQKAIEHGPVEIVDLPIKNADFP